MLIGVTLETARSVHIKDAFMIITPPSEILHLHFVITEPDSKRRFALVNISSFCPNTADREVILRPGEHPYVTKESAVFIRDTTVRDEAWLATVMKQNGKYPFKVCEAYPHKCTNEILERIKEAVSKSKHMPRDVQRYCIKQWGK